MKRTKMPELNSSIMDSIKSGQVNIKPKAYFMAISIVSLFSVVFSGVLLSYLFSIIFFWLKINLSDTMAWGARAKLGRMILEFPWWVVVLSVALISISIFLIIRQGRMYRHRLRSLVTFILAASMFLGFVFYMVGLGRPHLQNKTMNQGYSRRLLK